MAYSGTTAGTTSQNPPILLAQGLAGGVLGSSVRGTKVWLYNSGDLSSIASTANYFSDGYYLGMRVGDIVLGVYAASLGSTVMFTYMSCVVSATTDGCALSTAATQTSSQ